MINNIELNLLPIESIYESEDYVYGVLSKASPLSLLYAELGLLNNEELGLLHLNDITLIKNDLFDNDLDHKQMPAEALIEFVNLHDGSTEQVVCYLRRYGLFSLLDLAIQKDEKIESFPKKIQSYWSASYGNGLLPFARSLWELWNYKRKITRLLMLAKAIREPDEAELRAFYLGRALNLGIPPELQEEATTFSYEADWFRRAKDELSQDLKLALAGVVLGLKVDRGELVPTIASYGVADALALLTLDYIYRGIQLGECRNPSCKKLFFMTRATKRFCSGRCQALIKVHRFRNDHKRKKELKSSKKSARGKGGK
jgi:hypothetical protein